MAPLSSPLRGAGRVSHRPSLRLPPEIRSLPPSSLCSSISPCQFFFLYRFLPLPHFTAFPNSSAYLPDSRVLCLAYIVPPTTSHYTHHPTPNTYTSSYTVYYTRTRTHIRHLTSQAKPIPQITPRQINNEHQIPNTPYIPKIHVYMYIKYQARSMHRTRTKGRRSDINILLY